MKSFTFQFLLLVAMAMGSISAFADGQLQVVADPADSSVVQSLSKIGLTIPQYGKNFSIFSSMREKSTVTNDATGESAVTSTIFNWYEECDSTYFLEFTPAVTEVGSYTVTIPANIIYLWVEVDSVEQDYVYDLPIVLHYAVSQSTGISDVKVEGGMNGIRVNLNGQCVGDDYQGVVIVNRKKLIQK